MSVDDRLRDAFGETDRSWDEQVPDALAAVTARRRHESVVRRGAAAALVAAAAVATVAVTVSQRTDDAPSPSEEPTTPATTSTTAPAEVPESLTGNWLSRPITRADVRRAARDAGKPDKADLMLAGLPAPPFRVVLVINGDRHETVQYVRSGGQDELFDQENVEMRADRLVLSPQFAEGENVHTWVVEDGVLRMDFVSTSEAEHQTVPAEAWQRLFYDTAAFTREQ